MKKQMKKVSTLLSAICLLISCKNKEAKSTDLAKKASIAEAISIVPNASVKETISYYNQLKKESPEGYNFNDENELNNLGYQYLNNNDIDGAISIFKLLTTEFPKSANAYDSLGEAYYAKENYNLSLLNYKKSLELNPKNQNAEQWIYKIGYKQKPKATFLQVFTKKEYLEDTDEMVKNIVSHHPNAFGFISEEAFYDLVTTQKSKIKEGMTYAAFLWQLSPIFASIACEHSHMNVFNQEDEILPISLRFPIEADLIGDKLLVTNAHINGKKVSKGNHIVSINGIAIEKLTDEIFKHIASNGHSMSLKRKVFSAYITSYIPYHLGFPKSYEILLVGDTKPVVLTQLNEFAYTKRDNSLGFKLKMDLSTAILKIPSFNYYGGEKLRNYKQFIDSSFMAIKNEKIKNLIVDVRNNGGGCSCAAIYLLKQFGKTSFGYFAEESLVPGDTSEKEIQKPIANAFKGKTYVLINGFNTSTTGHLLSVIKHYKMATLIGEESGASYYANAHTKDFISTNTGFIYSVSRNMYTTVATELPNNKGVLPDHEVYTTGKDINTGVDTQLNYTMELINGSN